MNKEMFLVGLLVGLVVHEGGVLQQPQSVGGDGPAQPGWSGRWLRDHHGRRLAVGKTEGTVVGEGFDAGMMNNVRKLGGRQPALLTPHWAGGGPGVGGGGGGAARTGAGRRRGCGGGGEAGRRRRLTACAWRWPSLSGPSSSAASAGLPSPSARRQSRSGGGRGP